MNMIEYSPITAEMCLAADRSLPLRMEGSSRDSILREDLPIARRDNLDLTISIPKLERRRRALGRKKLPMKLQSFPTLKHLCIQPAKSKSQPPPSPCLKPRPRHSPPKLTSE
ncbi:MAG: hypothetical protein SGPRY_002208 [Prymnesium sp.]